MTTDDTTLPDPQVTCVSCEACCCRLEAMLFNDTEVPKKFIETDTSGRKNMARLEDGWCAALDRDTMSCTIYRKRPWICREFEMEDPIVFPHGPPSRR